MDDPHRDAMAAAAERVLREWFENRKPWKLIGDSLERAMASFLEHNRESIVEAIARAAMERPTTPTGAATERPQRFSERDDEDEEWEGPIEADGLPPFPDKLDF